MNQGVLWSLCNNTSLASPINQAFGGSMDIKMSSNSSKATASADHHHQHQQVEEARNVKQARRQQQGGNKPPRPQVDEALKCPRCNSSNTKFCYYNNYSMLQPRYLCKACRRYWTQGGSLRNVPIGSGCRKNKHQHRAPLLSSSSSSSSSSSILQQQHLVSTASSMTEHDFPNVVPMLGFELPRSHHLPPLLPMLPLDSGFLHMLGGGFLGDHQKGFYGRTRSSDMFGFDEGGQWPTTQVQQQDKGASVPGKNNFSLLFGNNLHGCMHAT